jgi:acyl dehydratase
MASKAQDLDLSPMDTTDVDKWLGVPLAGTQLKEPITVNDIRRWTQGMQNPNPLYYDEAYAEQSVFGGIVAPQSFTVCTTVGHGAQPAIQGNVPGSHMLFGGDEWWFYGPRIRPGDMIRCDRMLIDYKVTHTKFAGPTMFSRGDTTYVNQNGEIVGKQRSTSIRYRADNARKMNSFGEQARAPEWTIAKLDQIEAEKFAYYATFQNHQQRTLKDVKDNEELPRRPIGPHTLQTFTTEWRSYLFTVWGSNAADTESLTTTQDAGWLPEMTRNSEKAAIDPTYADGLYYGASRGHVHQQYAQLIGVPRGYGYGATMGAWVLDYLTNWGGELGFVMHCNARYIGPAFVGDATFLTGRVTRKEETPRAKSGIVTVDFEMRNQSGMLLAKGPAEIRLPLK